MKMKVKLFLSMCLVLILAGTSTIFAQGKKEKGKKEEIKEEVIIEKNGPGHYGMHGKRNGMMGIKDLTDEQKQKIEKIKLTNQKENLQLRNKLSEKKAQLTTLECADNADMGAINKIIDEMAAIKAEMHKKRAVQKQEIRKILTDEQRLQFDLRSAKKGSKQKNMRKIMKYRGESDCEQGMFQHKKMKFNDDTGEAIDFPTILPEDHFIMDDTMGELKIFIDDEESEDEN